MQFGPISENYAHVFYPIISDRFSIVEISVTNKNKTYYIQFNLVFVACFCCISCILEAPYSNTLLIGVGGSGKQSLCNLGAFLSSLEVYQITLHKGYAICDLKVRISVALTFYFYFLVVHSTRVCMCTHDCAGV